MKKEKPAKNFSGLVICIYFFSGACSLVYEVIWRRLLKLILGNTTYATSITVAVFLGGLALGAFIIRNKADLFKNKLRAYGIIESIIAILALLTPAFLNGVDIFYKFLFRSYALSASSILLLQIFLSSLILLIPAILMGCTLPIISSWLVKETELIGFKTGRLYAFNTLGGLTGAFISGFYLIRLVGVYNTYYVAIGFNLMIAITSFLFAYFEKKKSQEIKPTPSAQPNKKDKAQKVQIPPLVQIPSIKFDFRTRILIDIWLFMSGFIALGYEIIWMRTIVHYVKAEIYVFSAILCVYLLGYALGVNLGSWLVRKIKKYLVLLGITIQLVGICGVLYIPSLVQLPIIMGTWFDSFRVFLLHQEGFVIHLFISFLLFFLPSLVMGIGFPFLIQMRLEYSKKTGNTVATAYSINTVGCVLGSLAAGFLLIPYLGSQISIELLGLLGVVTGLLAIFYIPSVYQKILLLLLLASSLLFIIFYPSTTFLEWINVNEAKGMRPTQLIDVFEGINTTASVHLYLDDNSKVISSAGMNVAGDSLWLRQTQKVQGHIPIILHGNPQKVLTVGFGSGELTKTLTFHHIPEINCVEIAPEMVALAKKNFSHINLGKDLEEKVNMIYMDAKNYIHLTDNKYDVIMNDSIYPGYCAESSSLYTKEYFSDGKRLLDDNGVYSTWLPLNVPTLTLMSIIKTFSSVFENTIIIYPHNVPSQHMLLVGQKKAHQYSYLAMSLQYNQRDVIYSLNLIGIKNVNSIIEYILTDFHSLNDLTKDYPMNSDVFPAVEFDVDRGLTNFDPNLQLTQLKLIIDNTKRVDYGQLISFDGIGRLEAQKVLADLNRRQQANNYLFESFYPGNIDEQLKSIENALKLVPDDPDLIHQKNELQRLVERMNQE